MSYALQVALAVGCCNLSGFLIGFMICRSAYNAKLRKAEQRIAAHHMKAWINY